jgi:hypothetical protein
MSNTKTSQNQGSQLNENRYTNYANLLEVLKECQKKQPKSVSLKLQGQKHLYLQFVFPDTGQGFTNNYRQRLEAWNCPVTQAYAFRHLANQLGEREGIPQEIRACSLGHSVQVNDSTYKKRSNIRTTVDLLTNHKKQPLSLDLALEALRAKGFNIEDDSDNSVKAVLRIVYQFEI